MGQSDQLMLPDKDIRPTDDVIFSIMGDKKSLWLDIMNHLEKTGKGFSGVWNWYNDGKQWLFKMSLKKTTIFWSALYGDTFKITFYFGDKAEGLILASDLPAEIKDEYMYGKRFGKIRAVSLKVKNLEDVDLVKRLVEIKQKIR